MQGTYVPSPQRVQRRPGEGEHTVLCQTNRSTHKKWADLQARLLDLFFGKLTQELSTDSIPVDTLKTWWCLHAFWIEECTMVCILWHRYTHTKEILVLTTTENRRKIDIQDVYKELLRKRHKTQRPRCIVTSDQAIHEVRGMKIVGPLLPSSSSSSIRHWVLTRLYPSVVRHGFTFRSLQDNEKKWKGVAELAAIASHTEYHLLLVVVTDAKGKGKRIAGFAVFKPGLDDISYLGLHSHPLRSHHHDWRTGHRRS